MRYHSDLFTFLYHHHHHVLDTREPSLSNVLEYELKTMNRKSILNEHISFLLLLLSLLLCVHVRRY